MIFLNKWKVGLERTRKAAFGRIASIFGATQIKTRPGRAGNNLDPGGPGIETTDSVIEALKQGVHQDGLTKGDELQASLRAELVGRLDPAPELTRLTSILQLSDLSGSMVRVRQPRC